MKTRCPLCQAPIELAETDTDLLRTISSVECANCGLVPLHVERSTITFGQMDARQTIAHFELVRPLGRGSFGTVWLANDLKLGRQVALKVADDLERDVSSLVHEAQAAAELRHPNIVSIYEVGDENGRVYIASEFIEGMNLRDLLSTGRPKMGKVVGLTLTVAKAMQHAHDRNIVHRDIKPSNIMIDGAGEPYIADFGLAKRLSGDASISAEGSILGTALYMSPEQARGQSGRTDGRSDLYSLGVILFEMMTGHVPFRGNVHAVLHQKTREDPPSPRTLNPRVPKDLETICIKCLEREPDKRYRTAGEVAEELERFKTGVPIKARPVSSIEKAWRWCLRNRAVASLLAMLMTSMALGLIFVSLYWRQSVANARLANRRLYRSEMNLVSQYLEKGDVNAVRRTLERFESDESLSEFRDFAWHYHKRAISPYLQVSNQGDPVIDVAVFPNARFYAACGNNQQIRVWDAKTGDLLRTLTIENRSFQSIAASPANSHLASGSTDGFLRIWNPLQNDRPVRQIQHGTPVRLVRYSRDGKLVLSAGRRGLVRLWNAATGKESVSFPSGQSGTVDVRFSPDGKTVAVATRDGRIRLRDVRTGDITNTISPIARKKLNELMESMVWSDDGKQIVTGSYDGKIRIWSVESGERLLMHTLNGGIIGDLEFLDQTLLAIPTIGGELLIFDTVVRNVIRRMRTHNLTAGILDRSSDGRVLAIGSGGGSVKLLSIEALKHPTRLWHQKPGAAEVEPPPSGKLRPARRSGNPVRGLAFLPDGKHIVSASADGGVSTWNINDGTRREIAVLDKHERVTAMAADPAGKLVAAAILKEIRVDRQPKIVASTVKLWSLDSKKLVGTIDRGKSRVVAVAFAKEGGTLAMAEQSGRVAAYRTDQTRSVLFEETPHAGGLNDMAMSPRGDSLALAFKDGAVLFVDAATGKLRDRKLEVSGIPLSLKYLANGRFLAIGTEAGELQLRDAADGSLKKSIQAHASRVNVVGCFPDGKTLVSGGRDWELNLWDAASGERITTLYGHRRQITSLAISADGKTIASGGLLGDMRIWRSR